MPWPANLETAGDKMNSSSVSSSINPSMGKTSLIEVYVRSSTEVSSEVILIQLLEPKLFGLTLILLTIYSSASCNVRESTSVSSVGTKTTLSYSNQVSGFESRISLILPWRGTSIC